MFKVEYQRYSSIIKPLNWRVLNWCCLCFILETLALHFDVDFRKQRLWNACLLPKWVLPVTTCPSLIHHELKTSALTISVKFNMESKITGVVDLVVYARSCLFFFFFFFFFLLFCHCCPTTKHPTASWFHFYKNGHVICILRPVSINGDISVTMLKPSEIYFVMNIILTWKCLNVDVVLDLFCNTLPHD